MMPWYGWVILAVLFTVMVCGVEIQISYGPKKEESQ
jgi:hypothetical protein